MNSHCLYQKHLSKLLHARLSSNIVCNNSIYHAFWSKRFCMIWGHVEMMDFLVINSEVYPFMYGNINFGYFFFLCNTFIFHNGIKTLKLREKNESLLIFYENWLGITYSFYIHTEPKYSWAFIAILNNFNES